MRAVICRAWGPVDELKLEDVAPPAPGRGQLVIDVKATGVNYADAIMVAGSYQTRPPFPFSPGLETAGVVTRCGEGVTRFRTGDRVMAILAHGGFAEQALADEVETFAIPDAMPWDDAGAFPIAYVSSHVAIRWQGRLERGETLLVLGAAGGVGLAAIEIAKAMGAKVIACASSADKLEVCRQHGADEVVNYSGGEKDGFGVFRETIKQFTGGKGVDVVYDAVGGPYSEPALRSTAWRGRFLVVGFAAGEIPKIPLNLTLLKGCSIVGVFWGDFARREPKSFAASIGQLGAWFREGKLKPHVSQTFPLVKAVDALKLMAERKVKGKVVLTTG
jgi:NADPH2:quinone reductase